MNNRLELTRKTPEALKGCLVELGQGIETKLMETVKPEGVLDDESRFVEMTYHGALAQPNEMGRYDWRDISVTIPDDSGDPHRYAVKDKDGHIEWVAGDATANFTDADGRVKHEATVAELEGLANVVVDSHLFDPDKERLMTKDIEIAMVPGTIERIVPIKGKPLSRLLGRRAAGVKR